MANYVGVDNGSATVKVAVCSSTDAYPQSLALTGTFPQWPSALLVDDQGSLVGIGPNAIARLKHSDSRVAFNYRDRLNVPGANFPFRTGSIDGVELLAWHFHAIRQVIEPQLQAGGMLGVTVPDHWQPGVWQLSMALKRAGWMPRALVREWVASMTMVEQVPDDEAIVLSAGFQSLRATLIRQKKPAWHAVATVSEESACGNELRRRLDRSLCDQVTMRTRKDPAEDDDAHQALYMSIESGLLELLTSPSTTLQPTVFGTQQAIPFSREQLADLAGDFRGLLRGLIESLLAKTQQRGASYPIYAWGELAHLLPLNDWLSEYLGPKGELVVLPLDSVAAGMSRILAVIDEQNVTPTSDLFGSLDFADGVYDRGTSVPFGDPQRIPCLEALPGAFPRGSTKGRAQLVLIDDEIGDTSFPIDSDDFLIGRSDESHLVFDYETSPTVSGKHVRIVRHGSEYFIEDQGSSNGTYLNDAELRTQRALQTGDQIRLGRTGPTLRFEIQ